MNCMVGNANSMIFQFYTEDIRITRASHSLERRDGGYGSLKSYKKNSGSGLFFRKRLGSDSHLACLPLQY